MTKPPPKFVSISNAIAEFLLETAEMLPLPFESPYAHVRRMHRQALGIPDFKKWQYNRTIKQLQKTKRLIISQRQGKQFIKLTRKGKIETLLHKLTKDFHKPDHWDGKWRLMIWDVPETSRKARNTIRGFVKQLGFYQLQKSVFITPFALPRSAVDYLNLSGLNHFIRIMRIDGLDDDRQLKKHFHLK